jgi:26S proteasome regulatory subunit N6
MADLTKKLE